MANETGLQHENAFTSVTAANEPRAASGKVLVSERLCLRHLNPADAGFILELTNDPEWIRYIGDRGIRTPEDALAYIETGPRAMYAQHGFGLYAVELRDLPAQPIGLCGLLKRPWLEDADLGFAFLPGFRRAGYAYEAAAATLGHARAAFGMTRVLAIVTPGNAGSIRLLEKLGMRLEQTVRAPGDASDLCLYAVAL